MVLDHGCIANFPNAYYGVNEDCFLIDLCFLVLYLVLLCVSVDNILVDVVSASVKWSFCIH